jgi:thioredoxin reductase
MMAASSSRTDFDVVVVGGGPAGLSAALVLARCLRTVLVVDAGHPRNYASRAMHNYLTRDGIEPVQLLRMGREEIASLGAEFRQGVVKEVSKLSPGFEVRLASGAGFRCRKLLFATGVCDVLPQIQNLEALYGLGVHHCPYCDAYEYRGQPMAAYGRGHHAVGMAENLLTWSDRVTALTDGEPLSKEDLVAASNLGIKVRTERVACLEACIEDPSGRCFGQPRQSVSVEHAEHRAQDRLGRVVFESGEPLVVSAFFFNTGQVQRSDLPFQLGCRKDKDGGVLHDDRQRTGVPDLYLAGDASKDVQFIVVAAAEGARAGVAINSDFQAEATTARNGAARPGAGSHQGGAAFPGAAAPPGAASPDTQPTRPPPHSDG